MGNDISGYYATVSMDNTNNVTINIPIQFVRYNNIQKGQINNDPVTQNDFNIIAESIRNAWSGTFGRYHVKTNVIMLKSAGKEGKFNRVAIYNDTYNMTDAGMGIDRPFCFVSDKTLANGIGGTLNDNLLDYSCDRGIWSHDTSTSYDNAYPHEAGHLMGLSDRYIDILGSEGIGSIPIKGYENDIMAGADKVREQNITDIIEYARRNDLLTRK